ncbi:MAG: glycoside hydrolase family 5 protein [Bacteroidales bacterium]|nr:glycoside hydrolase family 5 protein [Bacteroidales bacterium]
MRRFVVCLALVAASVLSSCRYALSPRETKADGFVYIDEQNRFALEGSPWFPLMLNYKLDADLTPVSYYGDGAMAAHFQEIAAMGFNTVRICMDVTNEDENGLFYNTSADPWRLAKDTLPIFERVDSMLCWAGQNGLRVMLLIKPPLCRETRAFTKALLRHCAGNATLWAYDFMNEPLYFAPDTLETKDKAYRVVREWRRMMEHYAPHQLFTIGFAEPIEVFEWDPYLLPVDFVEIHTYHPLRFEAEIAWYRRLGKPWMIGETALPADNREVGYEAQCAFLEQSFQMALDYRASGYGWWEYRDCPKGVNFEAQYAGLVDSNGQKKPAAERVKGLWHFRSGKDKLPRRDYSNFLLYRNVCVKGVVCDKKSRQPVDNVVVRGWNEDWSVGVNTFFHEDDGCFYLWGNDFFSHFEISAPGYTKAKFDKKLFNDKDSVCLPNRGREYQSFPLLEGTDSLAFFRYSSLKPKPEEALFRATLDTVFLERKVRRRNH